MCSGIGLGFQIRPIAPIVPGKSDFSGQPIGPSNLNNIPIYRKPEKEESPKPEKPSSTVPSLTLPSALSIPNLDPNFNPNIKLCRAPPQPRNGHYMLHGPQCGSQTLYCDIAETTNLLLGSHLIYSCNSGYILNGSSDVSCNFEGKWLNIPVCLGM